MSTYILCFILYALMGATFAAAILSMQGDWLW